MNNIRRKEIQSIIDQLEEIQQRVAELATEELESFENLPGGLQHSLKGEKMSDAVDSLDVAESDIGSVIETLQSVMQ